jgi:N-acylneuraminate cytidylyltransferase
MATWAAIFARGGSKGVPGKNLRQVGGVSLIGRAVQIAVATPGIDHVICSTDDYKIAEEASDFGADVPFLRPGNLSTDESPEWDSWQHLSGYLMEQGAEFGDTLVVLPATAPLRETIDVESAIKISRETGADVVVSVAPAHRNPWFNMVTVDSHMQAEIVFKRGVTNVHRRQDAPEVFDVTTVAYVTSLGFVVSASSMFSGRVAASLVPVERALDIDTELDLEIAEFLHQRKKKGV